MGVTSAGTWTKVIWISADRKQVLLVSVLLLLPLAAAQISGQGYYEDEGGGLGDAETGFAVPNYDSHSELLSGLVFPFIYTSILLYLALKKALHFTFADQDEYPGFWVVNDRPDVRREALVISITITGMLVPTRFWDLIAGIGKLLGLIPQVVVFLVFLYMGYVVLKNI